MEELCIRPCYDVAIGIDRVTRWPRHRSKPVRGVDFASASTCIQVSREQTMARVNNH